MKNKAIKTVLAILLITLSFQTVFVAETDNVGEHTKLLDDIVVYNLNKYETDNISDWLEITAGNGAEFYMIALSQTGRYSEFAGYENALKKYIDEHNVVNAVTRQKYALCLMISDSASSEYITKTANETIGSLGIMSYVFGLHLLNNGAVSEKYTVNDVIYTLLSLQLDDGGWALNGNYSDTDVTAMVLQAIAPYCETDENVKNAAEKAVETLAQKQLDDGDFASYKVANPESVSQVIIGLTALGIDPLNDARFIKNGNTVIDGIKKYLLDDGSFCHTEGGDTNELATYQVFTAMAALERFYDGKSSIYVFDSPDEIQNESETEQNEKNEPIKEKEPIKNNVQNEEPVQQKSGYKLYVSGIIIIATIGLFVICIIKKQKIGTFLLVGGVSAVLVFAVIFTNIESVSDYYGTQTEKGETVGAVTIQIRCDTICGEDSEFIPKNGIILAVEEFEIDKDDTVYDILIEAARKHSIHIESTGTGKLVYIAAINHIYEFDYGDLSGWIYRVNGKEPAIGCGAYVLTDGDEIVWHYTKQIGNDID